MRVLLFILGAGAAVLIAGFIYQTVGSHFDRRRYTGDGRWVKIAHGCKLYLLEKGNGQPTVLFEAGIAATNLNWFHIQQTFPSLPAPRLTIAAD